METATMLPLNLCRNRVEIIPEGLRVHMISGGSFIADNRPEVIGWLYIYSFHIAGGYAVCCHASGRNIKNQIPFHKLIMPDTDKKQVDHINRDRLDNRRINLRYVNQSINNINRRTMKSNTSGIVGLSQIKKTSNWIISWVDEDGKAMKKNFSKTLYGSVEAAKTAAMAYLHTKRATISHYTTALKK